MKTVAEILAALSALEDRDAVIAELVDADDPVIKAVRSRAFAKGKKHGKAESAPKSEELDAAKERVTALEAEVETLKAKAPDKDALEGPLKRKIEKLEADLAEATTSGRSALQKVLQERDLARLERLLTGDVSEQERKALGIEHKLDPEYAAMKARELAGRLRYNDENALEVLDDDEAPISGSKDKPALAVLAAQVNKATPAKWRLAGGGAGGAGIHDTTHGDSGYDAAAEGKKRAEVQKNSTDATLAFR